MFIGHLGVALVARSKAARLATAWWVAATYLPDIVRWLLSSFTSDREANLFSHSPLAIAFLSIGVFAVSRVTCGARSTDWLLVPVCMSHWPLDVFTGCKPTWPAHANVGFDMYLHPLWDFPVELILLCYGWWLARNRVAVGSLLTSWATPVTSAVAQFCLLAFIAATTLFYIGNNAWKWVPWRGLLTFERAYVPPPPCGARASLPPSP